MAAAVGSQNASGYQLATGKPVMAIGGFNGSDPSPTLAQFQQYVADGKIHYFIGGGGFGGRGGSSGGSNYSSQIAEWVAANFTATTVGNTTIYDLTDRHHVLIKRTTQTGRRPAPPLRVACPFSLSLPFVAPPSPSSGRGTPPPCAPPHPPRPHLLPPTR